MLDTSEGPARTRRRMIKNHEFYEKYPATYSHDVGGKSRAPTSSYSDELFRAQHPELLSPVSTVDSGTDFVMSADLPTDDQNDIEFIARKLGKVSFSSQGSDGSDKDEVKGQYLSCISLSTIIASIYDAI